SAPPRPCRWLPRNGPPRRARPSWRASAWPLCAAPPPPAPRSRGPDRAAPSALRRSVRRAAFSSVQSFFARRIYHSLAYCVLSSCGALFACILLHSPWVSRRDRCFGFERLPGGRRRRRRDDAWGEERPEREEQPRVHAEPRPLPAAERPHRGAP